MKTLDREPRTRQELADEIGTYREVIGWLRRQFYIHIPDCGYMVPACPMDDYFIWLCRYMTQPKFCWQGHSKKNPNSVRLQRKKIVPFLRENVHLLTKEKFKESQENHHETARLVDFNGAYVRES